MFFNRLISTILLLLILSHGVCEIFIFEFFKAKYKKEFFKMIDEGISNELLVTFKFSREDLDRKKIKLTWIEKNEFRYNGKMYDVINKEVKSDSIYFICFRDENESALYNLMDNILKKLNKEDPDKAKELKRFSRMLSHYYFKPQTADGKNNFKSSGNFTGRVLTDLLEGEHFLNTPPPRI